MIVRFVFLIFVLFSTSNCAKFQNNKNTLNLDHHLKLEADHAAKDYNYKRAATLYYDLFLQKNNSQYLLVAADCYRMSGDCEKASFFYQKIIEQKNEYLLDASEGTALCLLENSQYKKAVSLFKEVLNQDVTRWKTLNALAIILAMNHRYQEAVDYFDMALEFTDSSQIIDNNKSITLAMWNKTDKAIEILKKTITTRDVNSQHTQKIELNLALLFSIKGRLDKTEEICKKYFSGQQLKGNLSFYASLNKDKKLAKKYLKKLLVGNYTKEHKK